MTVKDGRTHVTVQSGAWLWFKSEELCKILGTSTRKMYYPGSYDFQLGYKLQLIYLYCDIIEHTVVGDELVPCLRTVPISTEDSEQTWIRFENPHYVTLLKKRFQYDRN